MKNNEDATPDFGLGHPGPSAPPSSNPYTPQSQGPYGSPQQGPYGPPQHGAYAPPPQGPYAPPPQGPFAPQSQGPYEFPQHGPYGPPPSGPYTHSPPGPYTPVLSVPYAPPPSYDSIEQDGGEMNKIDEGMPGADKRKGDEESCSCCRVFSATCYIVAWICALFLIIYLILLLSHVTNSGLFIAMIIAAVFLGIGGIACYGESCCSRERSYLKNLDNALAIDQRLTTLRNTAPHISIHAVAYHYETRHRTVHYTDSHGHRRTRTETHREKVVTGRFNEVFTYNNWKDESEPTIMDDISPNRVTRIKMDLVVKFGDAETQAAFIEQYNLFKLKYRFRDHHVDFSESRTVAGFESHLAACMDLSQRPWWIRERCYCIATVFFCTWPYRMMFNRATAMTSFTVVKSVQCQRVPVAAYPFLTPGFVNASYQQ